MAEVQSCVAFRLVVCPVAWEVQRCAIPLASRLGIHRPRHWSRLALGR